MLHTARISESLAEQFRNDLQDAGAVEVGELTREDWEGLPTWGSLKLLEKRRLLSHLAL